MTLDTDHPNQTTSARWAWIASSLSTEESDARILWEDGANYLSFPPFERDSVLAAIEMLSPVERARFGGRNERITVDFETIPTSHETTMRCAGMENLNLVQLEDGNRVIVMAMDLNGDIDVIITGADPEVRTRVEQQLIDLVNGAASTWRGQRIMMDRSEERLFRHLPPVEIDSIHLDPTLERELRLNLAVPIAHYRDAVRPLDRRGVLLYGRPGTGKTWALTWVQSLVGDDATIIIATPTMFASPHGMRDLFTMAGLGAPTLVVLEDLDLTIVGRTPFGGGDTLGELLSFLDGPGRKVGVFLAATTNHPRALDAALTQRPGRFDRKIEVGDATEEARRIVTTSVIERTGGDPNQIETVVERTRGWSLAEINEAGALAHLTSLHTGESIDMVAALDDVHRKERITTAAVDDGDDDTAGYA